MKEEKGQEGTKGDEPVGRNGSAGDQGIPKRSPISERETGCTGVHIGCGYNLVSLRSRNRTFRVSLLRTRLPDGQGKSRKYLPKCFRQIKERKKVKEGPTSIWLVIRLDGARIKR